MSLPFSGLLLPRDGGADYTASGVDYDGTNDYATRGADLAGISDGKAGIISVWVRRDGSTGSDQRILRLTTAGGSATLSFLLTNSSDKFTLFGLNAAGSTILGISTVATYAVSASWRHLLVSWDLAQASTTAKIYVDDTNTTSVTTHTNDTINYSSSGNVGVGANLDGTFKWHGCFSEMFFHTSYLDLSVEANRRLFISAAGKPVNLGVDGSTPLGVQPLLYVPNGDPSTNKGSGGNFTVSGTLDAASTSPSD